MEKIFYCDDKFDTVIGKLTERSWTRDLDNNDNIHKHCSLIWTNLVNNVDDDDASLLWKYTYQIYRLVSISNACSDAR